MNFEFLKMSDASKEAFKKGFCQETGKVVAALLLPVVTSVGLVATTYSVKKCKQLGTYISGKFHKDEVSVETVETAK